MTVCNALGRRRLGSGVTSIEYALVASLIAIAIAASVGALGVANAQSWTDWAGKVVAALKG